MRTPMSFLILAALSAPALSAPPMAKIAPSIVGGYSPAPADSDARKAAQFALPKLKRGKARIRSLDAVERQVVAGTNYRIEMTLTDGSHWKIVVWQRLDGRYQLSQSQRVSAAMSQANYVITGRVTYRERMALPAGSVVKVQLLDVSRADAPARLLAEKRIVTTGQQVPIPFTLSVARFRLPGPSRNSVGARIESASGRLLWITDTINTAEPDGSGNRIEMADLVLVRAVQ
jgi:putative lipoprotein